MLLSMTGYGKATGVFQDKKVSVEIRSLNSKSLDLNARMASVYKELEVDFRKVLSESLDRGKVDLAIYLENSGDSKPVAINKELAQSYYTDLKNVNDLIGENTVDYLSLILRMPDIFTNLKEELQEAEKQWIVSLVREACDRTNEFRRQEGIALEKEFEMRIAEINTLLQQVPQYEQARLDTVRSRMKKHLEEFENYPFDDNRLEQEMIFYVEKFDISEEKMRLSNHLDYFLETMKLPLSGKKLGFISQEIGREINTLGSKSNHAEMQKIVVQMKDCLEKIKEQILNTL